MLKTDLFSVYFDKIQYLNLGSNKIQQIEPGAFSALSNLKWIRLYQNAIEEISHKIFEKNLKLEFIDLTENKLQLIHPEIFDGLANLIAVETDIGNFRKSNATFSTMEDKLKPFFDSYLKKHGDPKDIDILQLKEKLQENNTKYNFLRLKYQQAIRELQEESRTDEATYISLKLLENYSKLNRAYGDITFEFRNGEKLKAHKSVLSGRLWYYNFFHNFLHL